MSEHSKIEWTDHTFNPWVGCTKVSPGCDHCYAEGWARRSGLVEWGSAPRRRTGEANWREPLRWDARHEAFFAEHGRRQRVFCASLADVFDNQAPDEWRADLFGLIAGTPDIDWLLLTKRIGNVAGMVPADWLAGNWPSNLWLGATIVNQAEAMRDVPRLLALPAPVRFLSMEPLLGPVDLGVIAASRGEVSGRAAALDWIIVGGESGPRARPIHPDWVRSLRDQCVAAGVPFLFKQWGEWAPYVNEDHFTHGGEERRPHAWVDAATGAHGKCWLVDDDGTWANYTGKHPQGDGPDGGTVAATVAVMGWYGKKETGRLLDGVLHDAFPTVSAQTPYIGRQIDAMMTAPGTSYWLRGALQQALTRDCVDAARDAQQLAGLLTRRCDALIEGARHAEARG